MQFIFRSKVEENFTVLKNSCIRDKNITWEARGMLHYLLSQPGDWEVSKEDLIAQSPSAGDYAVARILKELETARYIFRKRIQNERGHWKWVTLVFDTPYSEENMNELDKECAEILGPEILERTRKIKENSKEHDKEKVLLSAIGIGEKDPLEGYPPDVKPRLLEFIKATQIAPTKRKKGFWIQTDREWAEMGVLPQNIAPMCKYAMENFGGIAGPQSITSAYHMMKTAKKKSVDTTGMRVAK